MIHLALKTEYSFKQVYGHLENIVKSAGERGESALGIADVNNTFGHVRFSKLCKKYGIKPIFGVRLSTTDLTIKARSEYSSYNQKIELIFIAKNNAGLRKLYQLVNIAYDQFYYIPRLNFEQITKVSKDILIITPYLTRGTAPLSSRIDYIGFSPAYPIYPIGSEEKSLKTAYIGSVAIVNNNYISKDDKGVYELLSYPKTQSQTYPQWILSEAELLSAGVGQDAINKTHEVADLCNAEISKAEMLKFKRKIDIKIECMKGALKRNIDLDDKIYKERLEREIQLIKEKNFEDYFFVVADILNETKKTSLVGPGRGSSGGSLVCYLLGITEINPIKHGLLFERFIDINRYNLPDIDSDIPDVKRQSVIKYIEKIYGKDNVKSIGTINTYKPKSAIGEFAKFMQIPIDDTENVKSAIIERSSGDARAALCINDTFTGTEIGKNYIKKYPEMEIVSKIEGHARHSGKHAAGIIVSNKPLYYYGGINSREFILMMDHIESESLNLLKIDILGLRTLSILEETAKLANFNFENFYKLNFNDQKTFDIFNQGRLYGVFQFEGHALRIVTSQMGVESFDDLCAITSLGRPGALNSGGAAKYIKRRHGKEEIISYGKIYDNITKNTYGIVIYQEQTMMILKQLGNLSWKDVDLLRRAISKSYGDEFFSGYKEKFIAGAIENGYSEYEAEEVWTAVASMGSYGFNKSHAVAYSMISYWTAWCKAHHPLEFAAANLNHAKDNETAVKILRDFVVNDGIEYIPIDPDLSDVKWTINNGKLLGGLTNLDGIGEKKAQTIIKSRQTGRFTPAIAKKLLKPVTDFDILFPTDYYFGKLYTQPNNFGLENPPEKIVNVNDPGDYVIIGKVAERDLRDRNDVQSVIKRGYEVDKNQFYLNLYIEDDTGSIKCTVPPYSFDDLGGKDLAEQSIPGKTWYIIKGKVRDQWRSISVENIINLEKLLGNSASTA